MVITAGIREIISSMKTCSVISSYAATLLLQESTAHHAPSTPSFSPLASSLCYRWLRDQCPRFAKVFFQHTAKGMTGKAVNNSTFWKTRFRAIRRTHSSLDVFAQFLLTSLICFPQPVFLVSIALQHDSMKDYLPVDSQFKRLYERCTYFSILHS